MGKLKVFEAFAGIGAQRMALRNIGVDFEVVGISEIDKFAIKSYEAIHGECPNYGDISKINPKNLPNIDLFTYSFPCQDLSVAGRQEGIVRGKTRSGLLYECEKIIEAKKPKYLLLENVKNLIGKRHKQDFDNWLKYLENLGYTNYYKVLNAKDFGIPQNRERVFCISILGKHTPYTFPNFIPLTKNIKDILEYKVDNKYYLSDEKVKNMKIKIPIRLNEIKKVGNINPSGNGMNGDVFDANGISPALTRCGIVKISLPYVYTNKDNKLLTEQVKHKVRRLTPRECFRLMGVNDKDVDKVKKANISNSQQYKQAGNSIVVPVLESIFKELFING